MDRRITAAREYAEGVLRELEAAGLLGCLEHGAAPERTYAWWVGKLHVAVEEICEVAAAVERDDARKAVIA